MTLVEEEERAKKEFNEPNGCKNGFEEYKAFLIDVDQQDHLTGN